MQSPSDSTPITLHMLVFVYLRFNHAELLDAACELHDDDSTQRHLHLGVARADSA